MLKFNYFLSMAERYGRFVISLKFDSPDLARAAGVFADALIRGRGFDATCDVLGNAVVCSTEARGETTGEYLKKLADLIDLTDGICRLIHPAEVEERKSKSDGEVVLWLEWKNLRRNLGNGARN